MSTKHYIILSTFLINCGPFTEPPNTIIPTPVEMKPALALPKNDHKLVVVAPSKWNSVLKPYVDFKVNNGFFVELLNVDYITNQIGDNKEWANQLKAKLMDLSPNYVFLVGDGSTVPIMYQCSDIEWSASTSISCISDDYQYTTKNGVPQFALGRLLTSNIVDVANYVNKVIAFESKRIYKKSIYLLNDREYDQSDRTVIGYSNMLVPGNADTTIEVLNSFTKANTDDDFKEAGPQGVSKAFNDENTVVMYYGHGETDCWGYYCNVQYDLLTLNPNVIVPFVYVNACQTAVSAPNVPWYPFYDSNGYLKNFAKWDVNASGKINASETGTPGTIQPNSPTDIYSKSIGMKLTNSSNGAMVYIGYTVITSPQFALNEALVKNTALALDNPNMKIGDIWFNSCRVATGCDIFNVVGDPSSSLMRE